jgi:two-component system response regulator CssR
MIIYLVEDEKNLRELLVTYLEEAGYTVTSFSDGNTAYEHIDETPDLWILDIMLPGRDGFELIKSIKKNEPGLPVIFMSARNTELDRVLGLELGSEDYLPKPFLPRELVLRVERILKRKTPKELILGDYRVLLTKRQVTCHGDVIEFTNKEFQMLAYFCSHIDEALSRDMILENVWGKDYFGSVRVIDDTLRRLRKKLPNIKIEGVYGYGYILKGETDED